MAFRDHKGFTYAEKCASVVLPGQAVRLIGTSAALVVAATNNTFEPFGVVEATALVGEHVTIYGNDNIVRAKAAASMGAGADVFVAPATAAFAPVVPSGMWRAGISMDAAAAGDSFSLYVSPRRALA